MRIIKLFTMNFKFFKNRQLKLSKDKNRRVPLRDYYSGDLKMGAIADAVEKGLRDDLAIKIDDFHPNPNDLLYEIYGIMDEDLSDFLIDVSKELKFEIRQRTIPIDYDTFSIRDLIELISADYSNKIGSGVALQQNLPPAHSSNSLKDRRSAP